MLGMRVVERRFAAFIRGPASVRGAMRVIITATMTTVVLGGVLIWLVDRRDFPNIGVGMWWALQTVTTVGYGDVTPKNPIGRLVGAFVMFQSIAFISVITAAVTSTFVERARRERLRQETATELDALAGLLRGLEDVAARLERIERALGDQGDRPSGSGP
jgi:voltage-gated potassium channel